MLALRHKYLFAPRGSLSNGEALEKWLKPRSAKRDKHSKKISKEKEIATILRGGT